MKKVDFKTWLIIGLAVAFCISSFWNVKQNNDNSRNEERDKIRLANKDKQIRQLRDSLWKLDLASLDWIQAEKMRADRLEDKLTLANEQLKNTRIRHTRTDRERDSVLRATLQP
jgi:predicted RNase H-like nuclease (RuvC/YqgF family)